MATTGTPQRRHADRDRSARRARTAFGAPPLTSFPTAPPPGHKPVRLAPTSRTHAAPTHGSAALRNRTALPGPAAFPPG
jgi:hypothetical protein